MARAKAAREVSVLPRMIDMVVGIILAGVMTDPLTTVDVRRVRVAWLVGIITVFLRGFFVPRWYRSWSMGGRSSVCFSPCAMFFAFLRKSHQ
jgi:hypothetical protein